MSDTTRWPTPVPYIVCRKEEPVEVEANLRFYDGRLSYVDEVARLDRDAQGVLWGRRRQLPFDKRGQPSGTPIFENVHPTRQAECMREMRCQVCHSSRAGRNQQGWLFVVAVDPEHPRLPEGEPVSKPPLCLAHARIAVKKCPILREKGYMALRVQSPRLWGVMGALYLDRGDGRVEPDSRFGRDVWLPYRYQGRPHRGLLNLLASQLVRELHGCTQVDL